MTRFFIVWIIFAIFIYVYRYVLGKKEKLVTRIQVKSICVSLMISGVVVGFLFLLNNIQGV